MNHDELDGSAKSGFGRIETRLSGLLGDPKLRARGDAGQVEGTLQEIYGRAIDHANKTVADVDRFLSERTYATLGVVAGAAFVLGVLLGRGGTKVVYVRK